MLMAPNDFDNERLESQREAYDREVGAVDIPSEDTPEQYISVL